MTKLDNFWMSNEDWIEERESGFGWKLRDDAPEEAQESYKHYLEQLKEASKRGAVWGDNMGN